MIRKKVCMLGAFAVGKTSLVARFVKSIFSDTYQTTVGVKIESKEVEVDGTAVKMMLWDLHGQDDFQQVRASYIRGSGGLLLVVDGTRRETVQTVVDLKRLGEEVAGDVPVIVLLNKSDLEDDWELGDEHLQQLEELGCPVIRTSAKTGEKVEEVFLALAREMTAA